MKIDRPIKQALRRVFGALKSGEARVSFHSQNLNEDRKGNPKGLPWHGRAWLSANRNAVTNAGKPTAEEAVSSSVEWVLGGSRCGFGFEADPGEREFKFRFALPPVSLYLALKPAWKTFPRIWEFVERPDGLENFSSEPRDISFSIHDWALWWTFWHPTMSWKRDTPKWRSGSFHIQDFFLGKRVYREVVYENRKVTIPMPEGGYPGKAKLYDAIYGFERLPWKSRLSKVDIEVDSAIPFSGKGENSWDCGEDGCFGQSGPARTIEEAIGNVVGSALATRKKRGDPEKWPVYPPKKKQAAEQRS